ncbi:hypothetical protein EES47_13155 [Streptomyces sp. ADI98-12]|nr:hypothetical protein EES47_13155 [Streptomyces sp. ADI98-12]
MRFADSLPGTGTARGPHRCSHVYVQQRPPARAAAPDTGAQAHRTRKVTRHARCRPAAGHTRRTDTGSPSPDPPARLGRYRTRSARYPRDRLPQPPSPAPHPLQARRTRPGACLGGRRPDCRGRPVRGARPPRRSGLGDRASPARPPRRRPGPRGPRRRPRPRQAGRPLPATGAPRRGGPGPAPPRQPAQQGPRPPGHQPPLRRGQRLLRAGPRPLHGLLLRLLAGRRHPGERPARQARPDLPQARTRPRHAPARRRLRLGSDGAARRPRVRRPGRRRHPLARTGRLRPQARRRTGPRRPRRDPCPGLPGRAGRALRRDLLHRHGRARRRRPVPGVRRGPVRPAQARRPAPQPPDRPAPPGRRVGLPRGHLHRRLRLPRRRAGPRRLHRHPAGACRFRGPRPGGAARALRADAAGLGAEPGGPLGGVRPPGRSRAGPGLAALHGRLRPLLRAQPDRCQPDPRRPHPRRGPSGAAVARPEVDRPLGPERHRPGRRVT